MPSVVVIAKNVTDKPVSLSGLGVEILGYQQFVLSDYFRLEELCEAADLTAAIEEGVVVLNNGTVDFNRADSLAFVTPITGPMTLSSSWKNPVRVATTKEIVLRGLQDIDKVELAVADRVLVKDQGKGNENGLYSASGTEWVRCTDADTDADFVDGVAVVVAEGSTQADTTWFLTTSAPIVIGTTSLTFSTQSSGGSAVGSKGDIQFRGNASGSFEADSSGYLNYDVSRKSLTVGPPGTNLSNNPFSANGNVNGFLQSNVQNLSNGKSASSDIVATADTGSDSTKFVDFGINGSDNDDDTFTIAGALDGYAYCSGGNLAIGTDSAKDIILFTDGTLAANERARVTSQGSVLIGRGAKGTGDTDGFLYLGASPGVPTGTPRTHDGRVPLAIDSTNGDVYIYVNSLWVNAGSPSLIGRRMTAMWLPQTGTALSLWGMGATTLGTISHPALTGGSIRRARFASAATAGSFAGVRSPDTMVWRGYGGLGGFSFVCRFGMATNLTNARAFVGLYSSVAAIANVNPSTLLNVVGIALDSGDANWQLITNDQSGTATKTDLGANFVKSPSQYYELRMWAQPTGSDIFWRVTRLDTGVTQSGTFLRSKLPQNTIFLTPYIWITNNAVASSAQIEMSRMYLESSL